MVQLSVGMMKASLQSVKEDVFLLSISFMLSEINNKELSTGVNDNIEISL